MVNVGVACMLLALASSCTDDGGEFDFKLNLSASPGTFVTIEGHANPGSIQFHAGSYDEAKASMRIDVVLVTDDGEKRIRFRPGYCDRVQGVEDFEREHGTLRLETVTLGVSGLSAGLWATACEGEDFKIIIGS